MPGTGRYIREQSHKLSEQAHSGGKGTGRGQQKVPGKHEKTSVDDWRPPGVSTLKFIAVRSLIVLINPKSVIYLQKGKNKGTKILLITTLVKVDKLGFKCVKKNV